MVPACADMGRSFFVTSLLQSFNGDPSVSGGSLPDYGPSVETSSGLLYLLGTLGASDAEGVRQDEGSRPRHVKRSPSNCKLHKVKLTRLSPQEIGHLFMKTGPHPLSLDALEKAFNHILTLLPIP